MCKRKDKKIARMDDFSCRFFLQARYIVSSKQFDFFVVGVDEEEAATFFSRDEILGI